MNGKDLRFARFGPAGYTSGRPRPEVPVVGVIVVCPYEELWLLRLEIGESDGAHDAFLSAPHHLSKAAEVKLYYFNSSIVRLKAPIILR